jgi:integrase
MGMLYRQKHRRNWMMKYYRDGRAIVESARTADKTKAKQILKTREGDIARGVPLTPQVGRIRFEEAAKDVLTDYAINKRRSEAVLERRIRLHLKPVFGKRRMAAITTPEIRSYIAHRQTAGASNASINRELTVLKRMFSLSIQSGKLLYKPHIPLLREDNVRTGFFEPEQLAAVLAELPEDLRPVIQFGYITGWRVASEIFPLEWRQVNFESGEIRLDAGTTKNDDGRVFIMTRELRSLLERQAAKRLAVKNEAAHVIPWVFFRLVAKYRGGPKEPRPILSITKSWRTACTRAGLPGRIPHDLRRTAIRNLVRTGISERVAMRLTGHKTRSVFERYNIVSDGDLHDAAEKLNRAAEVLEGTTLSVATGTGTTNG